MDITGFEKIAPHLADPLVLVGFVLMLAYVIHWQLIKSGLLSKVDKKDSSLIIRLFLRYGFWLALTLLLAGVGLSAWNSWMGAKQLAKEAGQLRAINQRQIAEQYLLHEQLKAKDRQLETRDQQLNSLIDAVATVSKVDASAKMKQQALDAMAKGDAEQAKALLADLLKTKEAEGRKANKEAAEAARSLGALAYMNDTKAALAAYQKAVQLDPDNAVGWNMLGTLLGRTGQLAQAEEACRKVLALGQAHQNEEEQLWAFSNLGIVYEQLGDLQQAESMYRKALNIAREHGMKSETACIYVNLGVLYRIRGELEHAEAMYKESLKINEALGVTQCMATATGNLGNVYYDRGELKQAEKMFKQALEFNKTLEAKEEMARDYDGLGMIHFTHGELDKAEEMYRKSLEIREALGLKQAAASIYGNLGSVYRERGNLAQAEELWKKSLHLFQEMGHPTAKKVQQWLDELAQHRASQPAPPAASPRR